MSSSSSSSPPSASPTHRSPPSISGAVLEFLLKLTKFAGQNKVPILEWLLAWTTVVVFGIRYLIDYARLRWKLSRVASRVNEYNDSSSSSPGLCDCISLCPLAHTRAELSVTVEARWERLRQALLVSSSLVDARDDGSSSNNTHDGCSNDSCGGSSSNDSCSSYGSSESRRKKKHQAASLIAQTTKEWTDDDWIQVFRSDLDVRREASYLLHTLSTSPPPSASSSRRGLGALAVLSKLRRLWPEFLELPESVVAGSLGSSSTNADRPHDLSLIVPMYKERVTDIGYTLHRALDHCGGDPNRIQVVVVHAQSSPDDHETDANGDESNALLRRQLLLQQEEQQKLQPNGNDPNKTHESSSSSWGELKVVTIPFGEGGGRGKTLNVGAKHATAPILTFLHADTMVPLGWDEQIKNALIPNDDGKDTDEKDSDSSRYFPHACAFTMAIDDGHQTATPSSSPLSSNKASAGLLGAEWLGVLRCHCGLPYGDSVLSFGRPMFDYMGGYPEQPLMEDYEAMDWLRLRSVLLSALHRNNNNTAGHNKQKQPTGSERRPAEGLVLLRDRAKCSPRRWEKYGVAYTSLVNAVCIFRYRSNATAEDLFEFYYHCSGATSKGKE